MYPPKKKPTIYEVADRAGVSIATISRVLNNPEKVNPETRSRVLAIIDELGFIPKAEARARALSGANRVGVITPFFTAPSFVQRLRGVASVLATSNYELIIYTVDSLNRLSSYLSSLPYTGNLDGLILMSLPIHVDEARRLIDHGIETVLIEFSHPGMHSIVIDDYEGGRMAARHLLEKGHQRIAFLGDKEPLDYSIHPPSMRLKGMRQVLEDAGVSLPDGYVRLISNTQEDATRAVHDLLGLPLPPTAIFASSDVQALTILRVARKLGIQVPGQLAVIGFDDIDAAEMADLTTIRQHLDESGRLAVVVALLVVPLQLALVPFLRDYTALNLNGTYLAMWLAHTGFGLPLAIYLLFNYISTLPRDILESAFIDGASHFTIFLQLILPLSIPALASFAIFQFLWVWNDYLVALVFLGDKNRVVTSALAAMVGEKGQDWHLLTSGAFISMLLPLLVFFALQRFFVRGLTAGSVKG